MAGEQQQQPKQKMLTEDEHKKLLVEQIETERSQSFSFSISHGFQSHGKRLAPEIRIELRGGESKTVHALATKIERLILDHSENSETA